MNTIPKWITVVSSLITLLGVYVSLSLYFAPESSMVEADFSSPGVQLLTQMWAARQLAIAAIIAYAITKQSISMLRIALSAYCLMTLQDVFIGVVHRDNGLILGSAFFCLLSVSMIVVLFRKQTPVPDGNQ